MRAHLSRLKVGVSFLLVHSVLSAFTGLFLPILLKDQGYAFSSFVYLIALGTLFVVLLLPFFSRFRLNLSIGIGFCFHGLMYASIAFLSGTVSFVLFSFFWSLSIIFFWQPVNYISFRSSKNNTNATDSSIYFLILGLTSVIIPVFAGFLIAIWGYSWIFGVVACLYGVAGIVAYFVAPKETHNTNFMKAYDAYTRLKTITMFEGAIHFFLAVIIPLYTILFFTQVQDFGMFTSFVGLVAFIVAIFLAYNSDKTQKRLGFLSVFLVMMGLVSILLSQTNSKIGWVVLVGVFGLCYHLTNPIRLALSMDVKKVDLEFWRVREFFLNVGRLIFLALCAMFFYLEYDFLIFILAALLCFSYVILVKHKLPEMK